MSPSLLIVNAGLAVICVVCIAVIVTDRTRPLPARGDGVSVTSAPPPPAMRPSGRAAGYQVIGARNLFSPARGDAPAPVASVSPAAKPELYGIVIGDAGSIAYLRDPVSKRVFGHRVGDSIAGAIVAEISADRVVLSSRNGSLAIGLSPSTPRPLGAASVATPGRARLEFAPASAVTAASGTESEEAETPR